MRSVDIMAVRTVFDSYFRVVEAKVRYQLPNGQMSGLVRRLSLERGDSAAAVIVNTVEGTAIVARQFRFPTARTGPGWLLELVAGVIEQGETPEACIRREIFEELGYEVSRVDPISVFYTSPGGSSERVHLFHAEVIAELRTGCGGGLPEEGEDIETLEIPLAHLPKLLDSGEIVDAKTLIGLRWLADRLDQPGG
ncbi:NUDIX domain-containing protein [Frankia sp. AgB32]|uniref:NUDIX domain-containing protein n=1 Tax=Frankia sp. AgB32 TaxID=631119 RepID=UPI00200E153D|nr:NUDIX domain-containing protein [Frankia sp. AgB32]MCK9894009.1 NUDIX domain-containing protein [Frankia sp. AgB32]